MSLHDDITDGMRRQFEDSADRVAHRLEEAARRVREKSRRTRTNLADLLPDYPSMAGDIAWELTTSIGNIHLEGLFASATALDRHLRGEEVT